MEELPELGETHCKKNKRERDDYFILENRIVLVSKPPFQKKPQMHHFLLVRCPIPTITASVLTGKDYTSLCQPTLPLTFGCPSRAQMALPDSRMTTAYTFIPVLSVEKQVKCQNRHVGTLDVHWEEWAKMVQKTKCNPYLTRLMWSLKEWFDKKKFAYDFPLTPDAVYQLRHPWSSIFLICLKLKLGRLTLTTLEVNSHQNIIFH